MPAGASTDDSVTAQERLKWLKRNVLLWLVALLILALAVIGSLFAFGAFTTSSASPGNIFTAGNLELTSDANNMAILTAGPMVPGDQETGTVTIENVGNVAGTFSLTLSQLADPVMGTNDARLSGQLDLTVTYNGTQLYSGKLSAMEGSPVLLDPNPWPAGTRRTFTFTVSFPTTGTNARDNDFQGTQTQAEFTFHATAGTPGT